MELRAYSRRSRATGESPFIAPRKCGVLVADDEPSIRQMLDMALQREGFAVWTAADGQEALELYRKHCETINVVMLDVLMPRMDGPQTLAAIRVLTPRIPCCFMTGNLGAYSVSDLRTLDTRVVFIKPFHIPEVVQVLRNVAESAAPVRPGFASSWNTSTTQQT